MMSQRTSDKLRMEDSDSDSDCVIIDASAFDKSKKSATAPKEAARLSPEKNGKVTIVRETETPKGVNKTVAQVPISIPISHAADPGPLTEAPLSKHAAAEGRSGAMSEKLLEVLKAKSPPVNGSHAASRVSPPANSSACKDSLERQIGHSAAHSIPPATASLGEGADVRDKNIASNKSSANTVPLKEASIGGMSVEEASIHFLGNGYSTRPKPFLARSLNNSNKDASGQPLQPGTLTGSDIGNGQGSICLEGDVNKSGNAADFQKDVASRQASEPLEKGGKTEPIESSGTVKEQTDKGTSNKRQDSLGQAKDISANRATSEGKPVARETVHQGNVKEEINYLRKGSPVLGKLREMPDRKAKGDKKTTKEGQEGGKLSKRKSTDELDREKTKILKNQKQGNSENTKNEGVRSAIRVDKSKKVFLSKAAEMELNPQYKPDEEKKKSSPEPIPEDIPSQKPGILVSRDITDGWESIAISCVNEEGNGVNSLPESFKYRTRSSEFGEAKVNRCLMRFGDEFCPCKGDCLE